MVVLSNAEAPQETYPLSSGCKLITYLGSFNIGGVLPTISSLMAAVVPRLTGQLGGALRVAGQVTVAFPSIQARVNALTRIAAQVALQPPSVHFKGTANASLIELLTAQLALLAQFRLLFGGRRASPHLSTMVRRMRPVAK